MKNPYEEFEAESKLEMDQKLNPDVESEPIKI